MMDYFDYIHGLALPRGAEMRQRRLFRIICSGIVAVLLLCAGTGRALAADEYVSLYGYGQLAAWCAKTPCDGSPDCVEGEYPCTGDEYVYRKSTTIAGFRNLYDFNQARLLCGIDYPDADTCAVDTAFVSLMLSTPGHVGRKNVISYFPDHFRFFIPPGATLVTVNIYGPFGEKIGFVSRFRQPPAALHAKDDYAAIPWRAGAAPTLQELAAADVYQSNPSAFVQVLNFSRMPENALGVDEAGWVYVKKLPFTTSRIYDVKVLIQVDAARFMEWYNSVRSVTDFGGCTDSNAGGAGGYMCWDAGGDPWSAINATTPPVPDPEPIPQCSAQNLADCGTAAACEAAGGYWYDNACNAEAPCESPAGCPEADCAASHFYWYDDQCNELPKCRAGNESGCETSLTCDNVGGYWWDDACHADPACSSPAGCSREEYCTSLASGDGFYWWGDACHAEPDPAAACSRENLGACTDSLECQMNGGMWYNDGVCRARECSAWDVGACETEAECIAVGGTWAGTYCTAAASTGGCSAANLSGCTNQSICMFFGGVWVNDACRGSSAPGSPGDDGDADDNNGSDGGSSGVVSPGSGSCSSATPENCSTSVACVTYGGYWYDNGCHREPNPAPVAPAGDCDADHLSLCVDAPACAAAGGCWYGTECRVPIMVTGQVVEDYNQRRNDAWVDLGSAALDGELLAGEKIRFDLRFPCAATGTGSYGAVYLSGFDGLFFLQNREQGNAFAADGLPEPLERQGVAAIDTELLTAPLDVCEALGADYRGRMTVYFLNEDTGQRFNGTEDLLAAVNDADTSWYLGWYDVDIDCTREAAVELAAPAQIQAALTAAEAEMAATGQMEVVALAGSRILLQPKIAVAAGDAGQTVTPVMYIYLPDSNIGMLLPTGAAVALPVEPGGVLDFAAIFADVIELGGSGIDRFQVFYGYVLADGTVKSNAYEVRLGD
jgi:hypothetical protein